MSVEEKLNRITKAVEQIGKDVKRAGLDKSQRRVLDHKLYDAVLRGQADKVEFFIDQGALTIREEFQKYRSLFSHACESGHLEVVKVFAKLDLMDRHRDENGKTPLDYAVQRKHVNIIQYLERHPSY